MKKTRSERRAMPSAKTGAPSGLISRLLLRLQAGAAARPLSPPGQRSGHGSRSIVPYLRNSLLTRPSTLE